MNSLVILFGLCVAVALILASISVWSPRRVTPKITAIVAAFACFPLAYAGLAELLSKPKPVRLEWWMAHAPEATVLASSLQEDVGIFIWLQFTDLPEPRAYVLPWDRELAEQLQEAERQADEDRSRVTMRLPFEPSLDDREPKFYALPQPALPPKDAERPAAERFEGPGVDA